MQSAASGVTGVVKRMIWVVVSHTRDKDGPGFKRNNSVQKNQFCSKVTILFQTPFCIEVTVQAELIKLPSLLCIVHLLDHVVHTFALHNSSLSSPLCPSFTKNLARMLFLLCKSSIFSGARPPLFSIPANRLCSFMAYSGFPVNFESALR